MGQEPGWGGLRQGCRRRRSRRSGSSEASEREMYSHGSSHNQIRLWQADRQIEPLSPGCPPFWTIEQDPENVFQGITSHNAGIAIMSGFIKNSCGAEIYLLGIQPESLHIRVCYTIYLSSRWFCISCSLKSLGFLTKYTHENPGSSIATRIPW